MVNIALIIKKSGGNLDDFVLSYTTCRREGGKALVRNANKIKETFKNKLGLSCAKLSYQLGFC